MRRLCRCAGRGKAPWGWRKQEGACLRVPDVGSGAGLAIWVLIVRFAGRRDQRRESEWCPFSAVAVEDISVTLLSPFHSRSTRCKHENRTGQWGDSPSGFSQSHLCGAIFSRLRMSGGPDLVSSLSREKLRCTEIRFTPESLQDWGFTSGRDSSSPQGLHTRGERLRL